jgi:5'-nucleotidase
MKTKQNYISALLLMCAICLVVLAVCLTNEDQGSFIETENNSFDVKLRILAINDFHGHIATSSDSYGGVGRADYLASNIQAAKAGVEHSILVSAGDLIGASPFVSAFFHDEPTIEAMNMIGLEINSVGNHEFDEGPKELLRMQHGGSHPVDGDLDGDGFTGAKFEFLAANVIDNASGDTLFPEYSIREYGDLKVAFIGMTLEGTPAVVLPTGVAGLSFNDEIQTVNALVPILQKQGIESIVVLLHEGGLSDGEANNCGTGLFGPIADITAALDDAVDLVIAGHTNDEFICEIDGKWVTMADKAGRLFTQIDVTLNSQTKDMTVIRIENIANRQKNVTPDPKVTKLIQKYETVSTDIANTVIGTINGDITKALNSAGESSLGNVIADSQLAFTSKPTSGEAVVAFMNEGGIRTDLLYANSRDEADGEVTFSEVFAVQPFNNNLVTMTLTGKQIDTLLEQQWLGQTKARILQVSKGFSYTWDNMASVGNKVDPRSIFINGEAIVLEDRYRVTVNNFMAGGGGGYKILKEGTDRLLGDIDLKALVAYFENNLVVFSGKKNRIKRLN